MVTTSGNSKLTKTHLTGLQFVVHLWNYQTIANNRESFDIGGTGTKNGEHGAEIEMKRLPPMVTYSITKWFATSGGNL